MPAISAQTHSATPADGPYRVLFDQLTAGAARCQLRFERDQLAALDVLERNPAFDRVGYALPSLRELLVRVCKTGARETLQLRTPRAVLAVAAYPIANDELIVTLEDVTAHAELEQRTRESQGRFDQAFHGNAAAMVIAHQQDLRIIDVNPRWLDLFGATRAEVIGKTSVELGLISEASATTRIAQHRQFAEGYDIELELRTRAGAPLTVLASARPIQIPEGPCTLTTLIDFTGRKHAEEAFAVAFNASPSGMMLVDATSDTVISVNQRLLEMTRAPRDAFIGRRATDLALVISPPRDQLLAEITRAGRLDGVEVELACHGGGSVWTLASTEMITLHHKPHRLSVFTDMTVRKRFERRLLTQHVVGRTLAEATELETAIPHVLEALCRGEGWDCGAVWLPDLAGTLACHGTWGQLGVTQELALTMRSLGLAANGMIARVLASGHAEKTVLDAERCAQGAATMAAGMRHAVAFPILRGNAVLGVVAMAAREAEPALDSAERGLFESVGRLLGLFVERSRAEAALRELNSELERRVGERTAALQSSNRDLEAFSASVSHDLRAPLRAIHGFAEILLEDFAADLPTEARDLLDRIHASGSRLRTQIEDLLAFSRLGRDGLRRTRLELDPMVRSVVDEVAASRGLGDRLELRIAPLGSCTADPSLLRSVWTNLIDNALKYSRDRPRIVLEIGREDAGGEVVYYVRDNGVGFDPAHASRLFGVFQRLHAASEFEGTGIGLANVRRIIERHDGRVAATSELGRGSRFEFTLGPEHTP